MSTRSEPTELVPTLTRTNAEPKFPLLVSYAFLRDKKPEEVSFILNNPNIELLLDSGAFSALNAGFEIKLDEYLEFLDKWRHRLFGYIALDKLGDPEATARNLDEMIRQGFKPIPVHVWGDDWKRMDELFEMSDWVGLGGLRRPHRGPAPRSYVKQKMIWARGRNVHWLGYTNQNMVRAFRPYSCDCSSWNAGVRYGKMAVYLGDLRWTRQIQFHMVQEGSISLRAMRRLEEYGFDRSDVADKSSWRQCEKIRHQSRSMVKQVPTRGWVDYIYDMRRLVGTRVFLATALLSGDIESIFAAIDKRRGTNYLNQPEWAW